VGNITYEPNRVAARLLATEVLPALRELRPTATFELVGPHAGALDDVRGLEHIRVTGFVADVTPHYQHADVVVIPLRHGSGTRIKVLEAIAHRRPVVATSAAVNGLDLQHGREVLVAESTSDLARTVDNVLGDPAHAASLVERAIEVVRAKYTLDAVGPTLRAAVFGSILAT
jgi:glycosyltransferase involved in cell wall biosynthesis